MQIRYTTLAGLAALLLLAPVMSAPASAQSAADVKVLKGLAPVSVLDKTREGRAALGANLAVTGGIQTGDWRQPTLYPFAEQQQQALRDVFISDGNLAQLADGLGTTLGSAYVARAHYIVRDSFTNISDNVKDVIGYAVAAARSNSTSGKYFFANATTDGKKAVSEAARAIYTENGGKPDPFGRAYHFTAGSEGAGKYGNARPFQTEPVFRHITGRDYFGTPSDNHVYNRGPIMNLIDSPSYPSGHTTYGYIGSLVLALLVPDRYPEMIVRAADYGNNRIIVGAHYAMDVLGGRVTSIYAMAHLLANDPDFVGQKHGSHPVISDYRAAITAARAEVAKVLEQACGKPVAVCATEDIGRFSDPAANEAFYASTQTYGLPTVFPKQFFAGVDVNKVAPEAGYLLTVAYPSLTLAEANRILTVTLGPGGGFLDDGSEFGVYSRINLYAAARMAQYEAAAKRR